MKKVILAALLPGAFVVALLAVLLSGLFPARATDIPLASLNNTQNETVLSSSATTTTNRVGSSFPIEGNHYHTLIATNGAASQGWVVDRSLDGATWIVVGTNVLAAGAAGEVTMTGKWAWLRARQIGTNTGLTVTYLGGN